MTMTANPQLIPVTPEAHAAHQALRRIAFVALAAIGLGFLIQGAIIVARLVAGGAFPGVAVLAELAGSVSWSVLVCTGVAIGVSLGKARAALAGLFGLVFAPLGLAAAKAAQKIVAAALDVTTAEAVLSVEVIGLVRALEYGLLAFILALLSERKIARLAPYLLTGIAIGLVFGGGLSLLTVLAESLNGAGRNFVSIAGTTIREVTFPIGCAVLIYIGQLVAHSFAEMKKGAA
jgi:hypothetical protein